MKLNLEYAKDNSEEKRSNCIKEIESIKSAHDDDVNFVIFHPNINILASCADDNLIKIWDFNRK